MTKYLWVKFPVLLTGGSDALLPANRSRRGVIVFNRLGNDQIDLDIGGGPVAANTGRSILGGSDYYLTGRKCPINAITVCGTAGQTVNVWEAI